MNIKNLILASLAGLLVAGGAAAQRKEVSVNTLTGTANVVIPVYTLTRGQVTLPITLTYSATGIKPKDVEGSAGMGWQLQAGGQITREVRGLPDDANADGLYGWMNNRMDTTIRNFTINNASNTDCTGQALDSAYVNDNFSYQYDTEPDIFTVNAPGLSCKLVYDNTAGTFRTIPYMDLKVQSHISLITGLMDGFTITNDKGITYVFTAISISTRTTVPHAPGLSGTWFQNTYNQYQFITFFGQAYYDTFYLTSMTDANGNGVSLYYSIPPLSSSFSEDLLSLYQNFSGGGNLEYDQYATQTTGAPVGLDSIVTTDDDMRNNTLAFTWAVNGYDGTGQSVVTGITGRGKNLHFRYDRVAYNGGATPPYNRYFLRQYTDTSATSSPVNYQFKYNGVTALLTTNLSDSASYQHQDYWGYYTSNTTVNPNPALYVNPTYPNLAMYEIVPSGTIGSEYTYYLNGLAATADVSDVMVGTLDTIKYAQGGLTALTYESNDYFEAPAGTNIVNQGGGIRVQSIKDSDNVAGVSMVRSYSYINPNTGYSSGKPVTLPQFGFAIPYMGTDTGTTGWNESTMRSSLDLSTEDHTIMYEYVTVSQSGAGSTRYQYLLPAMNWDNSATPACTGCTATEWRPTVNYTAHFVCVNQGPPINTVYNYPFAPNPNYEFERGLLKQVTTYNEAGTPQVTSQTTYVYTRTGAPDSLVAFKWDRNEINDHHLAMLSYAKYPIYYGTSELVDSVITKIYDTQSLAQAQNDTTVYSYGATYHKLASRQTANSDHSLTTTYYKYTKDYTGLSTNANPNINAIYRLQQLNINTPTETYTTVTRGGSPSVIGASLTLFKGFPGVGDTLYMPSQQLKFVQPDGGGSFTPVTISGSTITKDSRYILEANYDEYDFTGVIQTADNAHRDTSASVLDHISYHPAIAVKNAAAYNVAFEDFDSDLIPAWTEHLPGFTGSAPSGSHTGNSRGMNNDSTFSYTIQKSALAANYIFSIWIRSSAGGSFSFSMAPQSPTTGTTTTATGTFASTGSAWQYFQWKLPMPTLGGSLATVKVSATLTSGAVIGIDDILIYPETAEVATYAYNDTTYYRTAATNTNGLSNYYINDSWGRTLYRLDQDRNITLRKIYAVPDTTTPIPVGYIQQDMIKVSGVTTGGHVDSLTTAGKQTSIQYYDGLGRPLQTVGVKASPAGNDMIQPVAYNALGQQLAAYLPYTNSDTTGSYRTSPFTEQAAFYLLPQYLIAIDSAAYSQEVVEASPTQRVLEAGMTGAGFQPTGAPLSNHGATRHFKNIAYRSNNSTDSGVGTIIRWDPTGSYVAAGYSYNTLAVTIGRDEDSVKTITYTDLAGHTILKRQVNGMTNLDTYYIYDNAGMISIIVPPQAVAIMSSGTPNYTLTQTAIAPLLFRFYYNTQGQLTRKVVPGKGGMSIIYDPLNRPVLLQDSNMSVANKWNYIKYDVKGRAIAQGIYVDATHTSPASMQSYVSGLSGYSTVWYETRTTSATYQYYTNNIFPTSSITPLAYSYFDNYDLNDDGTADYTYSNKSLPNEVGATSAPIVGMPTMTSKSTVGSGMTARWLLTVQFYDRNLHPVQTQSNNLINYTANAVTDYSTTVPDFTGASTVSLTSKNTGSSTTVMTTPTYDQVYRVTAVTQRYNGGAPVTVAQYNYNDLGQLTNKGLGVGSGIANITLRGANNVSSTGVKAVTATTSITIDTNFMAVSGAVFSASIAPAFLQQVDFRFNIRGQLTSINNSRLNPDGGETETDSTAVFGMQLLYNQTDANLSNAAYFNGKLSAVKWMTRDGSGTASYERAFAYSYDAVDRYTKAAYAERSTGGATAFSYTHGWDETVSAYDENGNIKALARNATTQGSGTYTAIDQLAYVYNTNNANQLYTVHDTTGNNTGFGIYTGGSSGGNYSYDANGNLTSDPYKYMGLAYNVLNRLDSINFLATSGKKISYIYSADGAMIRKIANDGAGTVTTTDYMDGFVYVNNALSYFAMPEGRMVNNSGNLVPEYVITDQQGNARITFNNTGTGNGAKVIQENSYYGFGLVMPGSTVSTPVPPNNNLYNDGSELQNDFSDLPNLMQTFYRNYDAALGRWIGVDPQAEGAESMTPYQYAGDNPIMSNDPLGNKFGDAVQQINPLTDLANQEAKWESDDYQDLMNDLGGGGGDGSAGSATAAQQAAQDALNQAIHSNAQTSDSYGYASDILSAWQSAVDQGYSPYIQAGVRTVGTAVVWNTGDPLSEGGLMTSSVFFTGQSESIWSQIWNSDVVRAIIPDDITISVGFNMVPISGFGGSYNLTLLTRGRDAGFHLNNTASNRYGLEFGFSLNLSEGDFTNDPRLATYSSLLNTGKDVSVQAGLGYGAWYSYDPNRINWVGGTIGIGPGFGGSKGSSNTQTGW